MNNSSESFSFDSCVIKINSCSFINSGNKTIYSKIISAIDSNVNGLLSNDYFEESLARLANEWLVTNSGDETSFSAKFTGNMIALGLKSSEWWRENPSAGDEILTFNYNSSEMFNDGGSIFKSSTVFSVNFTGDYDQGVGYADKNIHNFFDIRTVASIPKLYFVAPWVAADAAGAVVGMTISAFRMYARGNFSANELAASTVIGGVSASLGIVGRVAGFFRKYFK